MKVHSRDVAQQGHGTTVRSAAQHPGDLINLAPKDKELGMLESDAFSREE